MDPMQSHPTYAHWLSPSALHLASRGAGHDLREFLHRLFRHRWIVLWFCIGVLGAVVIGLAFHTNSYEATAKILVKKGAAREPLSAREAPVWVSDQLYEEDINTEIGILTSHLLIERAAAAVRDDPSLKPVTSEPPAWRRTLAHWLSAVTRPFEHMLAKAVGAEPDHASDFDAQVAAMEAALEVEPEPRSNIIALRFVWPDPTAARVFLEALVDGYQSHRTELYEPAGAADFFRRQAAASAAAVNAAETELHNFLRDAGITMIDVPEDHDVLEAEKQSMLARQQRIDEDLSETRAQASQLASLLTKHRQQTRAEAARVRTELLERQRATLRGQLMQVEQDRGEQAIRLQRLQTQQAEVSAKLARIRVLEDKLRGLLLRDQGSTTGKALKAEVDRLYRELAQLGQLRRYDLNVGQDTGLYEYLQTEILDTEVGISGLDERAAMMRQRMADLDGTLPAPVTVALADGGDDIATDIEQTRAALARAGAVLTMDDRTSLAQGFEARVAAMIETEAELEGARARILDLEAQAQQVRQQLITLNTQGTRAKELRRELARAEEAYTLYRSKTDTATISAAMSREELVNTRVAQPPTVAAEPVGPGKSVLLLLGIFAAAAGGVGLALVLNALDAGISSAKQLERDFGMSPLGTVPEGATDGPLDVGLAAMFPDASDDDPRPPGQPPFSPPALIYPTPA